MAKVGQPGEELVSDDLKFGDLISLYDNENRGFMLSMLSGQTFASLHVLPGGDPKRPKVGNFLDCVFEVQPQSKYKANRKLASAIADIRKKNVHIKTDEEAFIEGGEDLYSLKVMADAENADNALEKKRRFGDAVVYGQVIQLFHVQTGRYIRISSTTTSKREPSNMKVDVSSEYSKHTWFKIMPRYKVRAEGDHVRMVDQVVLESVKTAGQFLHSTLNVLPTTSSMAGFHEVNLSVTQTAFVVYLFRQPKPTSGKELKPMDEQHVKGCDVIQLFHKEHSAYIAAEGSWAEGVPREDAHLRQRLPDPKRPRRLFPPTSCGSFWQVEIEDNPISGAYVQWEAPIRLRHIGTQQYLTLEKAGDDEWKVKMTKSTKDPHTVFKMHAVIREQSFVQVDTYTRIENVISGTWLHANREHLRERNVSAQKTRYSHMISSDLSRRMATVKWDNALLLELGVTPECMFDDAYIIYRVPEKNVGYVSFCSGMVPILRTYLNRPLEPTEIVNLEAALKEFRDWIYVNGIADRERQKIIRNLGLVEMLVEMLQLPFAPFNTTPNAIEFRNLLHPRYRNTKRICDAAYNVLQAFLLGDSRKNELYIARHIAFFQTQIGGLVQVEKMYTELVRDNNKIISNIGPEEISGFIELLKHDKNADYLEWLSVLCECEGVPIGNNQSAICRGLLENTGGNVYVYLTELNRAKGDVEVSTCGRSVEKADDWVPLRTFAASALDEDDETSTKEFLFLQKQLELFGKLCSGRNEHCIDVIAKKLGYLTWDECYHCAKDDKLPKSLRSRYVSLLINLFVDVGDNIDILEDIRLNYIWGELVPNPNEHAMNDQTESLSGSHMKEFPELSAWILSFLSANVEMNASDKPNNLLLGEIMNLTLHLIKFGFYIKPEDITMLMTPLLQIINGQNDIPHADKKVKFKKKKEDGQVLEWRKKGRFERSANNDAVVKAKTYAVECVSAMYNYIFTVRLQHFMYDFKCVSEWNGDRRQTRSDGPRSANRSGPALSAFEIRSLQLLKKADTREKCEEHTGMIREYLEDLFERSNWIMPGWYPGRAKKSKDADLIDVLMDLTRYDYPESLTKAMLLINRFFTAQHDLSELAVQALVLIVPASIKLAKDLLREMPVLRRLGAGQIEREEMGEFIDILNKLTAACLIEEGIAHGQNQSIIYNADIISLIIDVIGHGDQEPEVLSACFLFLQAMARGNNIVQTEVYGHLDSLMSVESNGDGWQDDMGRLVGELFTNNQKLVLAIKPQQVQKVIDLAAEFTVDAPNLLAACRAIAKIEEHNIPVKRNQSAIIKYLMSHRETLTKVALIDDSGDEEAAAEMARRRTSLLHSGHKDPISAKLLAFHLEFVSLLAACAEGENHYIESMCQTIFSLDDIIAVLNDTSIRASDKQGYLRFFLWAYLNTAGSPVEVGTAFLHTKTEVFQALVNIFEQELGRYADKPTLDQKAFVFEAFLPTVTVIAKRFYHPEENSDSIAFMRKLGGHLSKFSDYALKNFQHKEQLKTLSACYMAMDAAEKGCIAPVVMATLARKLTGAQAVVLETEAEKKYRITYAKEVELNIDFNKYSVSVVRAYEGKNTIAFQLPTPGLPLEADVKAYCEGEDDDEALPLGPEFQGMIDLFCVYKPHTRYVDTVTDDVTAITRLLDASLTLGATLDASEAKQQSRVVVKLLQVMRAIIHNQSKLGRETEPVQDEIIKHGVVLPIAATLHHTNDNVVREALACLVALLDGGNKNAQAAFKEHFLGTREETFFDDVMTRMRRAADSVREQRIVFKEIKDEQEKQAAFMGTLTLAGGMGADMQAALNSLPDTGNEEAVDYVTPMRVEVANNLTEDFKIKDVANIELTLRVLQQLCEGHNTMLQNYLREQPDNIRSMDLVAQTVEYLKVLIVDVSEDNIEQLTQTIETLVEFSQGCRLNQTDIFDAQAVDQVNHILRLPDFPDCSEEKVAKLKLQCANLVLAMLEDSDEQTVSMAQELEETLDVPVVMRTMRTYYTFHVKGIDKSWTVDADCDDDPTQALDVAYAFFNILMRLSDFSGKRYYKDPMFNIELEKGIDSEISVTKAFKGLRDRNVSIEILRDGRLQKIHFYDKWREHLREEAKQELLWHVERTSPSDKIRDFVARSRVIMADIAYLRDLLESSPIVKVLLNHSTIWDRCMLWLTFAINIIILAAWEAPADYTDPAPDTDDWYAPTLFILGSLHIFMSCLVFFVNFLLHPPDLRAFLGMFPGGDWVIDKLLPPDESLRTRTSLISVQSLYFIAVPIFSCLGILYHGYFYAFHLLHVVVNNDILVRVIQSVTKNGISLLWVAALMVIVIYMYSLAAFAFLRASFEPSEGMFCQSSWQCFISSLRVGLMDSLGTALPPFTYGFFEPGLRIIFDLSFFILITTIGLNVCFGIIVDTFSELRDEKYQIQEAMEGECFICSLKNYDFERFGNGFQTHVRKEHKMWNYLFFMMHLDEKDPTDYNSNEQFVVESLANKQETVFFPINRAMCLQNAESSGVEERLDNIESSLRALISRFDREAEKKADEQRRQQQAAWRQATL